MSVREIDQSYQCHTEPGITLNYVLRITSRARTATIRIREGDGRITAVIPESWPDPERFIKEYMEKNELLLLQKLSDVLHSRKSGNFSKRPDHSKVEFRISSGQTLMLFGQEYTARIRWNHRDPQSDNDITAEIYHEERTVIFTMNSRVSNPQRAAGMAWESCLKKALLKEIQRYYSSQKIQTFLKKYHVEVMRFTPRIMKGLWGSCTSQKQTIRLNTLLAQLPVKYLHYVMDHEMVHLVEANHKKGFYNLLGRLNPDAEQISSEMDQMTVCMDGRIRMK